MRSRTANWFLCKIRYEKVMKDGLQKKVTEQYVVDGVNFTDAECKINKEASNYGSDFEVVEIDRCAFKEVFFAEDTAADKWYKAKLHFITIDEKTEKEKKTVVNYLVQGASLENARKNIDEVMGATMIDYRIAAVGESSILDVFEIYD